MPITLPSDDELDAALAALAAAEGVSKAEAARRAVLEKLARKSRRVEVDTGVMEELAQALDRLGES